MVCEDEEALRKGAERAIRVLQARWEVEWYPSRLWSEGTMKCVWKACVIMHNMITEDEGEDPVENLDCWAALTSARLDNLPVPIPFSFDLFAQQLLPIQQEDAHYQLHNDLVDHLWTIRGEQDYSACFAQNYPSVSETSD